MPKRKLCVGVITAPHGVRGLVRLKSYTASPDEIIHYGPFTDEDGETELRIEFVGTTNGFLLARINGVTDRNTAEAIKGHKLFVDRRSFPDTEDEEFYYADLIGTPVYLSDGQAYGKVKGMHNFGAGDMIEIKLENNTETILPFTKSVVPIVNLDGGRIVVDPPEVLEAMNATTHHSDKQESG